MIARAVSSAVASEVSTSMSYTPCWWTRSRWARAVLGSVPSLRVASLCSATSRSQRTPTNQSRSASEALDGIFELSWILEDLFGDDIEPGVGEPGHSFVEQSPQGSPDVLDVAGWVVEREAAENVVSCQEGPRRRQ